MAKNFIAGKKRDASINKFERQIATKKQSRFSLPSKDMTTAIIGVLVIILLFVSLVPYLRGEEKPLYSFETFIHDLANVPLFDLSSITLDSAVLDQDWGAFEFLRVGLENILGTWFADLIDAIIFLVVGFVNIFILLFYFLGIIFGI